jgi:predicted DCC family thiol-disulfide oxidoreductase YuxK
MTMPTTTAYPLMLFFDGACPLCRLEMDRLRERDGLRRLVFVDIAEPGFDPAPWAVTLADMQALIHAARPDGSLLIGIDALHQAYTAVGLGHWTVPTTLPGLRPLLGRAYALFARRRYQTSAMLMPWLTRLEAARALRRTQACAAGGNCPVNPTHTDERSPV